MAPGIRITGTRIVIRVLPTLVADLARGAPVALTRSGGSTIAFAVTTVTGGVDAATAAAGGVVLVAQTGQGEWTVVTAG